MPQQHLGFPAGAVMLAVAFGMAGCQLGGMNLTSCPLPAREEVAEIRKLVPLGTPRDKAVESLRKAGISGSFGANESLYYCSIWKRPGGEHWQMNVVLLFDDSGKLYATQPELDGTMPVSPRGEHSPVSVNREPVSPNGANRSVE